MKQLSDLRSNIHKSKRRCLTLGVLQLLCCLSLVPLAPAWANDKNPEVIRIGDLLKVEVYDRQVILKSAELSNTKIQMLKSPPRAVIDLPDLVIPNDSNVTLKQNDYLFSVRIGRHDTFTRVVLDYKAEPSEAIRPSRSPGKMSIKIDGQVSHHPAAPEAPTAPIVSAAPIAPKAQPTKEPAPATVPVVKPKIDPVPASAPVQKAAIAKEAITKPATEHVAEPVSPKIKPEAVIDPSVEGELKFAVSTLEVTFSPKGRPVQDFTVKNRSTIPLYMRANVEAVVDPGQPEESYLPSSDILVSPRRFELAIDEERGVRLLLGNGQKHDQERVFRVNLIPSAKPFEQQLSDGDAPTPDSLTILIIVQAEAPIAILAWDWQEDIVTILNQGSANAILDHGKACTPSKCVSLPSRRIFPNAIWDIPVGSATSVEFLQTVGDEYKKFAIQKHKAK